MTPPLKLRMQFSISSIRFRAAVSTILLAVSFLLCASAGLHAQSTVNPPVDGAFDWYFRSVRQFGFGTTIYIYIEKTPQKDGDGKIVVPAANDFQVAPCPVTKRQPPEFGNCEIAPGEKYDCPYVEGMPKKQNCPPFTIGQSVRRAMAAWNGRKTGWKFAEVGDPNGKQVITVRMAKSKMAKGVTEDEMNGNPQLWPADNGTSTPDELPRIDDPKNPPSGKENDKSRGVPAFFRCLAPAPDTLGVQNGCQTGEIVFNFYYPWGISEDNQNNANDQTIDPIIAALHELGHAQRLDHDSPELKALPGGGFALKAITFGTPNGIVMRPVLGPGVHNVNPTDKNDPKTDYARNPSGPAGGGKNNTDTNSAAAAVANPIN